MPYFAHGFYYFVVEVFWIWLHYTNAGWALNNAVTSSDQQPDVYGPSLVVTAATLIFGTSTYL